MLFQNRCLLYDKHHNELNTYIKNDKNIIILGSLSSMNNLEIVELLEETCMKSNLACYDPYDIWMTNLGIKVKQLYNSNRVIGIVPAAILTIFDQFLNNNTRFFYKKKEYPTVRALAALTMLNVYNSDNREEFLICSKSHIDWLIHKHCKNYSGLCWGLGFKWAAGDGLDYNENTPFSTHTPYALEAIHKYIQISGDLEYVSHIKSIYKFYETDIKIMYEDEDSLATSYGPSQDRLITNAVSYTLYAYSIFLQYMPEKEKSIKTKIRKLYNFILKKQLPNGSWIYEPENNQSFIDCFHSCFILKNIFKSNQITPLPDNENVINSGYNYVKNNFYDTQHKLFKRFTLSNKPSIVKFDLYDNAEALNLSILLNDQDLTDTLLSSIQEKFIKKKDIYSVIDIFNIRRNRNTLRWAVMPYLYALSTNQK